MRLDVQTQAAIVGQPARGLSTDAAAAKHRIPPEVVRDLALRNGHPDLGQLAKASEALALAAQDEEAGHSLSRLAAEAKRLAPTTLGRRADKLLDQVDALAKAVDAERAAAAQRAQAAEKRSAEVAAAERADHKAEQQLARARAQLRTIKGNPHTPPTGTATSNALVRAWAHEHSIDCPARGRIPSRVLAAYEEATNAA